MSQRAIVVFLGIDLVDDPAWYARWLKPGFIHCFVLIATDGKWIKLEGKSGALSISILGWINDVEWHYRRQGAVTVKTTVQLNALRSPFVARTCVGLIKSVLGIRSFAVTPWQLYQNLTRAV